ncbi:hypothetical protein G114_13808 [Aeromonas diversa CDC 2478-85]|uniref:DUF6314 domain-containing protein n=1 Tax=Aeromonas diversa CDC 2478-85 TaxID=1268237 RepID=N9VIT4_9GAMM|nr:hypothetical protein G114_13808 [Aeromonas diversa CDC 2478-85]
MMTDETEEIHSLWCCLAQIASFSFEARQGEGSRTDWSGQGQGGVTLLPWQGGVRFEESGHYTTPHGQVLAMSNSYGWQRGEAGITLCHLRFGSPVHLFELKPIAAGIWESDEPHQCGADRYQARLVRHDAGFDLSWQIHGPRKNEALAYRYRIAETKKPVQGTGEGTIGGSIPK